MNWLSRGFCLKELGGGNVNQRAIVLPNDAIWWSWLLCNDWSKFVQILSDERVAINNFACSLDGAKQDFGIGFGKYA